MKHSLVLILAIMPADCSNPRTNSSAPPTPLRAMSFNIRYGTADDGENSWLNRRELLFGTIRDFDPDLLGTQEGLAFQVREILAAMPQYGAVGAGRDDGKSAGEFCALFYRADRFDVMDEGHFWLSRTPDVPGSKSWDSSLARMATWVKLRDKRDPDREILFINTHWDHAGPIARLESAKLIRQFIIRSNAPVIITADLNCAEDDAPYAELLAGGESPHLIDSYASTRAQRDSDEATFHAFKHHRRPNRLHPAFAAVSRDRSQDRAAQREWPFSFRSLRGDQRLAAS